VGDSLRDRISYAFNLKLGQFEELGPDVPEEVREYCKGIKGLDLPLRFQQDIVPGGSVRSNDAELSVIMDDGFVEMMSLLIATLVLFTHDLDTKLTNGCLPADEIARLSSLQKLFRDKIKSKGVSLFWDSFRPRPELCRDLYETILLGLYEANKLHTKIAKMAVFAAVNFVTLHEAAHACGGHVRYRQHFMKSLTDFQSDPMVEVLREHQCTFELVADAAARECMLMDMLAHEGEFSGVSELKTIAEHERQDVFSNVYCTAFSAGFGIAAFFLLTDALFLKSPEEYHPPSLERMLLLSASIISKCSSYIVERMKGSAEAITLFYHQGEFQGFKKCLDTWDALNFERRRDSLLEKFFNGHQPCILCNPAAVEILERHKPVQDCLDAIQDRMSQWGINDKLCRPFQTDLNSFRERLTELRRSREEHLAHRKTVMDSREIRTNDTREQNL
jgi:hypothetical protein